MSRYDPYTAGVPRNGKHAIELYFHRCFHDPVERLFSNRPNNCQIKGNGGESSDKKLAAAIWVVCGKLFNRHPKQNAKNCRTNYDVKTNPLQVRPM
jgi:hypothetical protein